ncbi:hypothetical protein M407DRAFT_105683 [Tulasnella calospora MUT 4182]|uniref:Uncharacterized protein n=1 Tax=Tulasnella calospora MUT 4182 TaxID=1051891 RepID=A0A0C3QTN1_9AGAM|nr:hypothetical protein M407DRAFT_105683 [Tulasnella calospora MUT 4182]
MKCGQQGRGKLEWKDPPAQQKNLRKDASEGRVGRWTEAGRCTRVVGAALRLRAGRWWGSRWQRERRERAE